MAVGLSLALAVAFLTCGTHAQGAPVQAENATFQASLARIAKGSELWRHAMTAVARAGRRVVILTPDRVRVASRDRQREPDRFDETLLAEVAPVVTDGAVNTVIVVVNLALLEERHRDRRLLPIEFEMDLDRILVHEIYGHAVPYLLAGDLTGRCADPGPDERAVDACSIRRENAVRAELGLGRRVDYGLDGLNFFRRH